MKQVIKSQQVKDRMRAAFGADVPIDNLPVYEAVILNTQPLRKSAGLFKNATVTTPTLTEMATAINNESAPIQAMHDTSALPIGRVFYAEVVNGDELRALFTITDPEIQAQIDAGTSDQVSVGYMPRSVCCSSCGFDFMAGDSEALWTLTCDEGHTLGEGGVHGLVSGVATFMELSLVGKGAAQGAKIVGQSDSRLAAHPDYQRLAASAKAGMAAVHLTATPKETSTMDAAALLAQIQLNATENSNLRVELAGLNTRVETIAALEARIAELSAIEPVVMDDPNVAVAVAALTEEAKVILTACQKPVENLPTEIPALVALIATHRAEFAAAIPVGGRSVAAGNATSRADAPRTAAFQTVR